MRGSILGLTLSFSLLVPSVALAETPTKVWVFFTDPGRSPTQLDAALDLRRAELGPRTLARRAKVRDDQLVDARDLLPAPAYVDAVTRTGAELHIQSRWLNAVSVEASPAIQDQLEALPFVRTIQPVAGATHRELEFTPVPLEANPDDYGVGWDQLDLIGVPELHDCGLSGAGVIIGVQDTGFWLEHQAYATTDVLAEYDFIDEDEIVAPELDDHPEQDDHGTWVLATITGDDAGSFRGASPGVSVILTKTEHRDVEESWEEDTYVAGLEWIESMGADIFTASLAYTDWYLPEDYDGATAVTTVAVEAAVANGLIVFVSMGNLGPEPTTFGAPADAPGAISLGATNVTGEIAPFSSRGPTADDRIKPDVVAPGWLVQTVSAETTDTYVEINGTSFSTPIAAGVGALLLEAYPWLTPHDMAELLRSTASQADMPDNDYGYGIIDAVAAAELYCTCDDLDGDFYFDEACGGTDCDDNEPAAHPGGEEVCDEIDNDCNGEVDDLEPECMPEGDGDGDPATGDGDPATGDGDSGDGDGDGDGDSEGESSSDSSSEEESGSEDSETGPSLDASSEGCSCGLDRSRPTPLAALILLAGLGFVRRRN